MFDRVAIFSQVAGQWRPLNPCEIVVLEGDCFYKHNCCFLTHEKWIHAKIKFKNFGVDQNKKGDPRTALLLFCLCRVNCNSLPHSSKILLKMIWLPSPPLSSNSAGTNYLAGLTSSCCLSDGFHYKRSPLWLQKQMDELPGFWKGSYEHNGVEQSWTKYIQELRPRNSLQENRDTGYKPQSNSKKINKHLIQYTVATIWAFGAKILFGHHYLHRTFL